MILTSSLAASKALEGHAVYAGSKAAVRAFARSWALELKARRVRVNVLSPGRHLDSRKTCIPESDRTGYVEGMAAMIPAGRLGAAEELAHAALYLASDDSRYVNGIELHVDGGMSLT